MVDCVVSLSSRRLEEERTNCAATPLNKPYILQFHISVISHLIMEEWIQSHPAPTWLCVWHTCENNSHQECMSTSWMSSSMLDGLQKAENQPHSFLSRERPELGMVVHTYNPTT